MCRSRACLSAPPGGRRRQSGSSANQSLETPCCRCTLTISLMSSLPGSHARPRRSFRRRYTVDLSSQNLAFEKTDASVLGRGSSAVVYKGMLDNKPVAIKVRKARMPAVVQLKSCCRRRLSSSKGSPKLRARGSAPPLGVQVTTRSVRASHMQVYEDMKSELAIMTKPKDPNVLVVHGVYAIRPAFLSLWEGPSRLRALLPSLQGGDADGAAARHRSVGPLGTQPPRRSEAPNQGRVT